ncbi:MAG: hypothetical protein M1814_005589 [Vezdaea aestivalis]|nr:MAG: hypothetical protein M1814_005589 [Vezdaea aestivalis]
MIQEIYSTVPWWIVIACTLAGIVFYFAAVNILEDRTIRALGGHAPLLSSYVPFGLDNVYRTLVYITSYRDIAWWERCFGMCKSRTLEATLGGVRMVLTDDPENIKAVLATQFQDYGKGPRFHHEWKEFLGNSIFTTDQELWHDSRALLRPQFIRDRVSDLVTFENHANEMLSYIQSERPIDIEDLFFRMTLDVATEFLLGQSVGALANPRTQFATAFNDVQRVQNWITRVGPLVQPFLPKGSFHNGIKVINSFVTPFIEQALRLSPSELEDTVKTSRSYTFLHAVAAYTRDPQMIRDQIVAVLLAGRDTTAGTLSWTLLELGRNPAVLSSLRSEILATVGSSRAPTYEDLKSMRYLNQIISETLRLYPSVPYNVRTALRDTTLPRGGGKDGASPVGMPKGTPVAYATLNMQRRSSLYPPGGHPPDQWYPDRWKTWQPVPWTYIPFNGGPRICVGQQFALAEIGYTLVRIFQRFESAVWVGRPEDVRLKCEIVLRPSNKVDMVFKTAGTAEKIR